MDSNLAQPCEKAISSEESRDSNVGPCNSDVDASHDLNCKDETLEAPKTSAMETTMEKQSNDGNGNEIIDGNRFTNLNVGKKEGIMTNRHLRVNGLNDKKLKVAWKEKKNSPLQDNGLNDKNLNVVKKREKVVRKETENSLLRDNGLNHKHNNMAVEWSGSRAETETDRKFQSPTAAEWNRSRAEMESKLRRQWKMEMENERDEYDQRWSKYNQDQDEWRSNAQSQMGRQNLEQCLM